MRTRRRGFGPAWLLVVVLLLAGCGQATTPPTPAAPTAGSPGATALPATPATIAGAAALEAYRGMWAAFVEAGRTSDWQSTTIGRYATGVALTNLSRGLYADHLNGVVTRGEPALSPVVRSVEPADRPDKVIVTDCGDSSNTLKVRASDGQPVNDVRGGRRQIDAVVEAQSDGYWKVSDFGVHEVGSC